MKDKEQIEPSRCSNCESLRIEYDEEAEHFECEDCGYIMKFKFKKKMNSKKEEQVEISKMCCYCNEEEATQRIFNPNGDEKELYWYICVTCKKIIEQQQKQSFGLIVQDFEKRNKLNTGFPERMVKESSEEIAKLSYESGKEVFGIMVERK